MYCFHCGTQIEDGATVCPACNKTQPNTQNFNSGSYVLVKPKVPGRGLGIAGMVLGIIGVVYCLPLLLSATILPQQLEQQQVTLDFTARMAAIVAYLFYSTPSILAVSLSGVGRKKGYRTGISRSGEVLGIIGITIVALSCILVLFA